MNSKEKLLEILQNALKKSVIHALIKKSERKKILINAIETDSSIFYTRPLLEEVDNSKVDKGWFLNELRRILIHEEVNSKYSSDLYWFLTDIANWTSICELNTYNWSRMAYITGGTFTMEEIVNITKIAKEDALSSFSEQDESLSDLGLNLHHMKESIGSAKLRVEQMKKINSKSDNVMDDIFNLVKKLDDIKEI